MGMLQTFASGLQASLDSWKQIAGQDDEVRECISQAPSLSACHVWVLLSTKGSFCWATPPEAI